MKVNYYEVLGVSREASEDQIRERFRRLARENHPDRVRGPEKADAEKKFQILTEAFRTLTNAEKKKQHDAELSSNAPKGITDPAQVGKVYLSHGIKAFNEKDFLAAYENFDMAVKHNPQDGKSHHHLALAAERIPSRVRQAVQAIETAVLRESVNATYLKDAGRICRRANLPAKAERYYEEALKWDPENPEIQNALAELRQGRGEAKEAGRGFTLFKKS